MDPLTLVSLVETCAGLAVTSGKLAIGLRSLAESYKHATITFRSLSSQCKLFSCSVRAIQQWIEDGGGTDRLDQSIQEQLMDSLECANDVIYALQSELIHTSGGTVNTFWEKANVVWNQAGLKNLEDCIHKQIGSLAVVLQIMNLPTPSDQRRELSSNTTVFSDSRSSAMSVRDVGASTLRVSDAGSTIRASTIATRISQLPTFDFDDVLMSSQVYLRNRNQSLALKSTVSSDRKTREIGTVVSWWDLPRLDPNDFSIDENPREKTAQELLEYISALKERHDELNDKYRKVKKYYFDKDAQVQHLEHQIESLKTKIDADGNALADIDLLTNQVASYRYQLANWRTLAGAKVIGDIEAENRSLKHRAMLAEAKLADQILSK